MLGVAAVAPVVVEELHGEAQPRRVALGHDDVQVGIALEDAGEREPAERLAHADALVVPTDVAEAREEAWSLRRRVAQPADVHRDRDLQRVADLPDRLPLRAVVRLVVDPVGKERRTQPHGRGALDLLGAERRVLVRQVHARRDPVEVRAPGLGQPVVDDLAVRDVDLGWRAVVEDRDAADEHRAVDAVTLEVGQHLGGVEAGLGLVAGVLEGGLGLGPRIVVVELDREVTRRAVPAHQPRHPGRDRHVEVPAVVARLEPREVLAVRLGQLVHQ